MTKQPYILTALLLAALSLCVACDSGDMITPEQIVELDVSVALTERPVVRMSLDGTAFENGDKFQFFFNSDKPVSTVPSPVASTEYEYNTTTKWTSLAPVYWDDYTVGPALNMKNFCAIMPFSADYDIANHRFTVQSNQSLAVDYKTSDLLIARVYTNKRLIPIKFYHVLSRVIINIEAPVNNSDPQKFNEGELDGMNVLLNGYTVAELTYNAQVGTETDYNPSVTVTKNGSASDITMHCLTAPTTVSGVIKASYIAIVPPQSVTEGGTLLTFQLMSSSSVVKTYYYVFDDNDSTPNETIALFEQGEATVLNLIMKKQGVLLKENKVEITAWGAGPTATLSDGSSSTDGTPIKLDN